MKLHYWYWSLTERSIKIYSRFIRLKATKIKSCKARLLLKFRTIEVSQACVWESELLWCVLDWFLSKNRGRINFLKLFKWTYFGRPPTIIQQKGGSIVRSKVLHALKRAERTDRPYCGHGSMSVNRGVWKVLGFFCKSLTGFFSEFLKQLRNKYHHIEWSSFGYFTFIFWTQAIIGCFCKTRWNSLRNIKAFYNPKFWSTYHKVVNNFEQTLTCT